MRSILVGDEYANAPADLEIGERVKLVRTSGPRANTVMALATITKIDPVTLAIAFNVSDTDSKGEELERERKNFDLERERRDFGERRDFELEGGGGVIREEVDSWPEDSVIVKMDEATERQLLEDASPELISKAMTEIDDAVLADLGARCETEEQYQAIVRGLLAARLAFHFGLVPDDAMVRPSFSQGDDE
jgi:hypothetical protein